VCAQLWDLRLENPGAVPTSGQIRVSTQENRDLALRCGFPNASPEVVHRPRSHSHLHFDIGTYSKFARKINFAPTGVTPP